MKISAKKVLFSSILVVLIPACRQQPYQTARPAIKHEYTSTELEQIKKNKPKKNIKDMTLPEALEAKTYYTALNQTEFVIKTLERIIALCTDHQILGDVMLELADLQLNLGNLEGAQKLYSDYKTLFPGSTYIKHARYQEIFAHYWDALDAERDQSKTQETIKLAQNFLEEFPHDDHFTPSVTETLKTCYTKLLESELHGIEFYLNKYHYADDQNALTAAKNRLAYVEKELLPHIHHPQASAIATQIGLATAENKAQPIKNITLALDAIIHTPHNVVLAAHDTKHPRDRF